jgi:hypothetical protein
MRSKADFEEQIAKYLTGDNSVFQYSNANDMRVTQDLNSFGEIIAHVQCSVDEYIYKYIYIYIYLYIFRVYYIRIIAKQRLVHTTWNTYSSIIIVRNVYVLNTASMFVYLFFTRSWSVNTTENVLLLFGGNVINTTVLH